MMTLEQTVVKAVRIGTPEILKNREIFLNLIEDLSPQLNEEREKLSRIYCNEVGQLLYLAFQSKEGVDCPVWKEIKQMLDQTLCLKESKQISFIRLFQKVLAAGKPITVVSEKTDVKTSKEFVSPLKKAKREALVRVLIRISCLKAGIENAELAIEEGDVKKAIRIYKQYKDGSTFEKIARFRLGQLYISFPEEAYIHYRRASELGDLESTFLVGYMNEYGEGTGVNIKKAVEYYQMAAAGGHRGAAHNLGYLYYMGNGVPKDLRTAYDFFNYAAHKGKADSMRNLGVMYENGDYVQRDYEQALKWYRKAFEFGYMAAKADIDRCQREMKRRGIRRKK